MNDKRPEIYPGLQTITGLGDAWGPPMPGEQRVSVGSAAESAGLCALILIDVPLGIILDTVALPGDVADQIEYDKVKAREEKRPSRTNAPVSR